jgi:hypothetical protein
MTTASLQDAVPLMWYLCAMLLGEMSARVQQLGTVALLLACSSAEQDSTANTTNAGGASSMSGGGCRREHGRIVPCGAVTFE